MKNIFRYLLGMVLFLNACDSNTQSSEQKSKDTIIELNQTVKDDSADSISPQSGIVKLFPGKDTLQLELKMEAGEHVTIPVDVRSGDSIYGKLTSSDPAANIRFTQIALPNRTFDGPFGLEMTYSIKSPGRYALIIGQNLMAGDPWNGGFTLKVWVK